MTGRKPPVAGKLAGKLGPADNEWIEERALAEIERLPTHAWENMTGLWRRVLPALSLSTQHRILARMFGLAAERGNPLSAKFVKRFAPHAIRLLAVPPQPRSRIRNQQGLRKAAEHRAANPKASWNELARAADVSRGTVRQWARSAVFQHLVRDAELRNDRLWELNKKLMLRELRITKLKAPKKRGELTRAPVRR